MSALQIKICKLVVQEDRTQPAGAEVGEEVVWWKRLIAEIRAETPTASGAFQAILDTRSNVLRLRQKEEESDIGVERLAEGIAYELSSMSLLPLSELMQERTGSSDHESVWLTKDGHLVSGLFHQLKEEGEFTARPNPPIPSAYRASIGDLLLAIDENLDAANAWRKGHERGLLFKYNFDASAWEAHRGAVLDHLEPSEDRRRFARFFRKTREFGEAVRRARHELAAEQSFKTMDARAGIEQFEEQAHRAISKSYRDYERLGSSLLDEYMFCLDEEDQEGLDYWSG